MEGVFYYNGDGPLMAGELPGATPAMGPHQLHSTARNGWTVAAMAAAVDANYAGDVGDGDSGGGGDPAARTAWTAAALAAAVDASSGDGDGGGGGGAGATTADMGPHQLHSPARNGWTIAATAALAADAKSDSTTTTTTTNTFPANKRPRRAAAVEAAQRVQDVLHWEHCKESSPMFKSAASQLNIEFDRARRGETSYRKRKTLGPHMLLAPAAMGAEGAGAGASGAGAGAASGDSASAPIAVGSSDDEGNADVEERAEEQAGDDDDDDDDDKDNESLASFVVSDSYLSDAGVLEQDSSDGQGESEVSGGEDDSESGSSDDDSDEEYVPPVKHPDGAHGDDTRMGL